MDPGGVRGRTLEVSGQGWPEKWHPGFLRPYLCEGNAWPYGGCCVDLWRLCVLGEHLVGNSVP